MQRHHDSSATRIPTATVGIKFTRPDRDEESAQLLLQKLKHISNADPSRSPDISSQSGILYSAPVGDLSMWVTACHEIGHAEIEWYLRNPLEEEGATVDTVRGRGQFHVRCCFNGQMAAEVLRNSHDEMAKSMFIRQVEWIIIRLLAGPVAEYIARGWKINKAIRFSNEYRNPHTDSSRIRDLLRGLTGKDDKDYQIRLQNECRILLTEERTWKAIEQLATLLLERGTLSGRELEATFESLGVPQMDEWY